MNLLLISNSTNAGEAYLEYPKQNIAAFLQQHQVSKVVFVPYAGVSISFDEYTAKVRERFAEIGIEVAGVHTFDNPAAAVAQAQAVVVGGGNTFHLLKLMYENGLVEAISKKVRGGMPYIGWSAGSNVACPTICTTNDMPIVQPASFNALNLVPFQLNPHYLDAHPDGHAGETREQRIQEYNIANPDRYVAGLREGCMFLVENDQIKLIGDRTVRVFKQGLETREVAAGEDLNFLLG